MKFIKKVDSYNNGIHTKRYYFMGIRYLKKTWGKSLTQTYLFSFKTSDSRRKEYNLIAKSKYFNKKYYLKNNPDVKNSKINPVEHYL